jgi:hypothetical protein
MIYFHYTAHQLPNITHQLPNIALQLPNITYKLPNMAHQLPNKFSAVEFLKQNITFYT